MKPHPRIRKTIKWTGAAVTVLLVVAWLASGRWLVTIGNSTGGALALENGRLNVFIPDNDSSFASIPGMTMRAHGYRLWWSFESHRSGYAFYCIPLWSLVLVAAAVTRGAWWYDALASRGDRLSRCRCPTCNYDRRGLAMDAVCPECGYASFE